MIKKLLASVLFSFFVMISFANELIVKKVFINQIVEHPALNMTVQGIVDGLKSIKDINIDIHTESAQGNPSLSSQIATKFVNQDADIVVGVGTISAQSFVKYANQDKVKLVFSSVTDPKAAGLSNNKNIFGVSNFIPVAPQLELFQKIQPNMKNLGFIYNPSEVNSLKLLRKTDEECKKLRINLISQTANKTSEIPQAVSKLSQKVDALFISNDNTALSALPAIIRIASKAKIPVYVSDTDSVGLGALAAFGPNQYSIGLQTAGIIKKLLSNLTIDVPIEYPNKNDIYINEDTAKKIGINIPNEIKIQASKIITKSPSSQ